MLLVEGTGSEIIEGFRLRGLLHPGQNSQVYEVVEVTSNRHFAMKLLLPENARNTEHRKFLFHEALVGKEMSHPNIIRIVKVSRSLVTPFIVMEFFPAGSLRARLLQKNTEFIEQHLQSILKQAATGLAFMNSSGWVHRDVKPDNILVNASGDVRLIDFALSCRIVTGLAKIFHKKQAMGTRSYMSPEQIRGQPLDGRADIYSFGITCYELATGRPPFRGLSAQDLLQKQIMEKPVSPKNYNSNLTDDYCNIVMHMLQKKKEDRPKDFHDVLMALRSIRIYKEERKPADGEGAVGR
jgi:serine/threonine-protein kinase